MEKPLKIILYIITGILLVNLLMTFLGNSNVKSIRQDLVKARQTSDSALNELRFSQDRLDSIKADMLVFRAYINKIENTVAVNDAEKRLKEERDAKKVRELKDEIKRRRDELTNDSLPDIVIVTNH
jgi:predicted  nucleic acid-binding Zn-ribbon protein